MQIKDIPIERIKPNPNQPRKFFDQSKLKELATSIRSKGLQQEITLRPQGKYFQIVQGERRWRACKLLGHQTIKAKIEKIDDEDAFQISLIENVQRKNLLPIEEAQAYESMAKEGLTHKEIAQRVGKSRTYVTQKLRILELPFSVRYLLRQGTTPISEGHVRQLLRLRDIVGRHQNLKRAKPFWRNFLTIQRFKDWVEYYQDYFAWSVVKTERISVADLKERIDKLYFEILSAIILRNESEEYLAQELEAAQKKITKDEQLTGYEQDLFCSWFEKGLREKMGLSNKTLEAKDFKFFSKYGEKHGQFRFEDQLN